MGKMLSNNKDSIGTVLSKREGLNQTDDLKLVGIKPINSNDQLISGSHLFDLSSKVNPQNDKGYITSSCFSPTLGSFIALGFLKNGTNRYGDKVNVINPILKKEFLAEICSPVFVDPNGDKLRA
jgi:sarcosine oxidase subunit alpha